MSASAEMALANAFAMSTACKLSSENFCTILRQVIKTNFVSYLSNDANLDELVHVEDILLGVS
jgi:hypothetical protein